MRKKFLPAVLILMLALSSLPVMTVSAATRSQAAAWAETKVGQWLDYDGAYGAQCVDLFNYYIRDVFGISNPIGSFPVSYAYQLPNYAGNVGWSTIQNYAEFIPEPGDIAIWSSALGGTGHVAIIVSANINTFVSIDQNWVNASNNGSAAARVTHNYSNFWGVIRPNFDSDAPPPYEPNREYPTTSVDIPNGTYIIKNKQFGDCITIATNDNDNAFLLSANNSIAQQFRLTRQADNTYTIMSMENEKYLDVSNLDQHGNVWTYQYNNNESQHWYITQIDGEYMFLNKASGLALTALLVNGWINVVQYGVDKGAHGEQFRLIPINSANIQNAVYAVEHKGSGKYISMSADSKENDIKTYIHAINPITGQFGMDQKLIFERQSDDTYIIKSLYSMKNLTVSLAGMDKGAAIIQHDSVTDNSRWYVIDCNEGYYKFVNKNSGLVLDVTGGGNAANGTFLEQWDDNGGDAQRFKLLSIQNYEITVTSPSLTWRGSKITGTVGYNIKKNGDGTQNGTVIVSIYDNSEKLVYMYLKQNIPKIFVGYHQTDQPPNTK
jgi:hypothetical protein